ncbi:DUF6176 family protein [Alcanivorax sp.]|jgi:hypothetical protein|uniref:DUF6176 family protein n=1 Tax=Alcanivorax sp. TaxID=1872427 RepID=UPI0032D99561
MDVIAALIELKPNSENEVHDWKAFIENHKEQALESLRAEGVCVESWFSLALEGKDYLLCYMRADSIKQSQHVMADSSNPVDTRHRQFKENAWVWGGQVKTELLVDLAAETDEQKSRR